VTDEGVRQSIENERLALLQQVDRERRLLLRLP